jgi:cytochrome c556
MNALRLLTSLGLASVVLAGCAPPKNYTPIEGIPKLASLAAVMDVQATTADPQFAKMSQASFAPEEFASFAETARKIDSTSRRIKDFSKGAGFDALADRLNAHAAELGKAAAASDAAAAREALMAMKATCKECHSKFR